MNELIFLLLMEIFLFVIAFALSGKDIMAPSVMMCAMFILSTFVALINAKNWTINYSIEASLIIITGLFAFIAGEVLYRFYFCRQLRSNQSIENISSATYHIKGWKLNILILLAVVVNGWNLLTIIESVGFSINLSSYFIAYRRLATTNLAKTGQSMNSGILSLLLKINTASGYLCAFFLVNCMINKTKNKIEKLKFIFIIVLSLLPSIMSGGRSGVLRMASAILIEYYIVWHQKNGWNRNLSWRYMRYAIISLAVGIPLFYYSMPLLGRTLPKSMFAYVSEYLGSSIHLFNLYVKSPVKRILIGEESLFSVLKVLHYLGLSKASTSYNLEFRYINNKQQSNVYTFFRRPLHDFGLFGMYAFTILIAFFFAWMYFKKIKYKDKTKSEFWVFLYGYLYYWIILSPIDQYSMAYISAGTVFIMFFTYLLYLFILNPAKWKCGKLVIVFPRRISVWRNKDFN